MTNTTTQKRIEDLAAGDTVDSALGKYVVSSTVERWADCCRAVQRRCDGHAELGWHDDVVDIYCNGDLWGTAKRGTLITVVS